jgi:hypothetical protein
MHFEGTRCARVAGEMKWRRVRATASVALGTLVVLWLISACNSPTLPTPPPKEPYQLDIPSAELASDGEHVTLEGNAMPGATVIFVNRTLFATNIDEASGVALAALDTGRYKGSIRVDLRCVPTNVIDIIQRDDYGRDSDPRTFFAPNLVGDASRPAAGGPGCNDGGAPDAGDAEGAAPDAGAD